MLRLTLSFLPPVFDTFELNDPNSPEEVFKVPAASLNFIAEIPPKGWQLDNIYCVPEDILDIPDMADPIPGEFEDEFQDVNLGNLVFAVCLIRGSATCTYTSTPIAGQACNINVEVESLNGGDTTFPFNMSAGSLNDDFELNVDQAMPSDDMPFSTQYTITETAPEFWRLDDIVCEGDADFNQDVNQDSVEIACISTGDVNCVFSNRRMPQPPPPAPVPTLSEWGLIAMAGALGLIGYMVSRRRKASA